MFRSLFQGRNDVYPRRFENQRTGKSGYAPACGNEWVWGVCEKPRIKCAACSHQRFLPVTDDVIRWHLSGHDDTGRDFVMGVYPMLLDETCFFLAADLDKTHWQEDARAILETCQRMNLPAALERSRSGNGGHIWLFFEEAISAAMARKLGAHILTETMERRPDIGLESYDRFFPNQDTLPQGGFGNLIALPLQKQPRECLEHRERSGFAHPDFAGRLFVVESFPCSVTSRLSSKANSKPGVMMAAKPSSKLRSAPPRSVSNVAGIKKSTVTVWPSDSIRQR